VGMLKISILEHPVSPADTVFDFWLILSMKPLKRITSFLFCPIALVEDLPLVIDNMESLPEEPNDWLHYFPHVAETFIWWC